MNLCFNKVSEVMLMCPRVREAAALEQMDLK